MATNNEQLQIWLRSQTGTSLDFNGDMLAFLSLQGYNTGDYNERLYLYLNDQMAQVGGGLSGVQALFAQELGFDSWDSVTSLSVEKDYYFNDGNNFFFNDGNNFVFNS